MHAYVFKADLVLEVLMQTTGVCNSKVYIVLLMASGVV